jgi:hypothetical protein
LLISFFENRKIIHLHFFGFKSYFFLLFFLFYFFRRKIILTIHDIEELTKQRKSNFSLRLSLHIFKKSDACIVHNNFTKNSLNYLSKVKIKNIYVINHGNYDDYVRNLKAKYKNTFNYKNIFESKFKHILFFGSIKSNKGLGTLIDGYKRFIELNTTQEMFKLIIAGAIHDVELYKNLLSKLSEKKKYNIYTNFEFVSERNLHYLFSNSDLIVLPYSQTYQSGVMLLAMAYKKPILVSNLEPFKEVIVNNNHDDVLFFEKNNFVDLANKLKLFSEKSQNFSNGFWLDSNYKWYNIAQKTTKVYQRIGNDSKK